MIYNPCIIYYPDHCESSINWYTSLMKWGGKHFRTCVYRVGCHCFDSHVCCPSDNSACLLSLCIIYDRLFTDGHRNDLDATDITLLISSINLIDLAGMICPILSFSFTHWIHLVKCSSILLLGCCKAGAHYAFCR